MKELNAWQALEASELNLLTFSGGSLFLPLSEANRFFSGHTSITLNWERQRTSMASQNSVWKQRFDELLCLLSACLLKREKISTSSKTML